MKQRARTNEIASLTSEAHSDRFERRTDRWSLVRFSRAIIIADMPSFAGVRVVTSRIHGYGVVATRDFIAGEVIANVDGVPWNSELPGEDRDDSHSLWLRDDWYYDIVDDTRFV